MAGRSKPTIRVPLISVTGTVLIDSSFVASISTYFMPFDSNQSISAWQYAQVGVVYTLTIWIL